MAVHTGMGSQSGDPREAPKQTFSSAPSASSLNIFDETRRLSVFSLSPGHAEYLKNVQTEIENRMKQQPVPYTLRLIPLSSPQNAQAFVGTDEKGNKAASIIIFSDHLTPIAPYAPVSLRLQQAYDSLKATVGGTDGDIRVANAYVITPHDFSRFSQMGGCIYIDLIVRLSPMYANITVDGFVSKDYEFLVDRSVEAVRAMEDQTSPHALRPRTDIGFRIISRKKRNDRDNNPQNRFTPIDEGDAILAVGGYVDFVGPLPDPKRNDGLYRYTPVVCITSITSTAPTFGAIAIALPLAVELFLIQGGWKKPFSSFAKGKPNIGNLTNDPEKKDQLWEIKSMEDLNNYDRLSLNRPYFCLDITEGRYRIPDLYMFQVDNSNIYTKSRLSDHFSRFFNTPMPSFHEDIASYVQQDFIGSYGTAGAGYDTRNITYLDQVATHGRLDDRSAQALLNYYKTPEERAQVVSNLTGGFVSLFANARITLNAEFLVWLSRTVSASGISFIDPNGVGTFTPMMNVLPGSFNDYTGFQSMTPQLHRTYTGFSFYGR